GSQRWPLEGPGPRLPGAASVRGAPLPDRPPRNDDRDSHSEQHDDPYNRGVGRPAARPDEGCYARPYEEHRARDPAVQRAIATEVDEARGSERRQDERVAVWTEHRPHRGHE